MVLMEDRHFRMLLDRFGYSWAGYRRVRKGVKKRLSRHMQETGCRNIGDYSYALENDQETRRQFELLMTVSISRFFRDRPLWDLLQGQILPLLAGKPGKKVPVWSAGCASGEEPYSFKMLWEDARKSSVRLPELSILATDLCPGYLERARAGIYPHASMREVPDPLRAVFFEKVPGKRVALKSWIREGITWRLHNLLSDPPGTSFDLIFLRNNLLTYLQDKVKIPALGKVVDSLAAGGFLIVGRNEELPVELPVLKAWGESGYLFQKSSGVAYL